MAVTTAGAPSSRAAASSGAAGGWAAQTAATPARERPQPSTMRRTSSACAKAARQAATSTPTALPGHGGQHPPEHAAVSREPRRSSHSDSFTALKCYYVNFVTFALVNHTVARIERWQPQTNCPKR